MFLWRCSFLPCGTTLTPKSKIKQTVDNISYGLIMLGQLDYAGNYVFQNSLPCVSQVQFTSVTQSCPTLQHTRLLCPSSTSGVCSNSCPKSQWCHLTISPSIAPSPLCSTFRIIRVFSSESVLHIRWPKYSSFSASASVFPKGIQGWFPLRLTSLISLLSKGLSKVHIIILNNIIHS